MNKYRDKSDSEINKAVAENVGIIENLAIYKFYGEVVWNVASNDVYNGFTSKKGFAFDPCNNPADAMPIVEKYGIGLMRTENQRWFASSDMHKAILHGSQFTVSATADTPYRAAMEVFLMMKDAENEKI